MGICGGLGDDSVCDEETGGGTCEDDCASAAGERERVFLFSVRV